MNESRRRQYLLAALFPLTLAGTGIAMGAGRGILAGLARILLCPSVLLHDYVAVGGMPAAFLNAGALGLLSVALLAFLRIDLSGPFIAAFLTVVGFAFFGKNLLNVWPVVFGVWLFARVNGAPFKKYALIALFGTTLSPLVSALAFEGWLDPLPALAAGLGFGVVSGFVLPPLASHMLRFHDGYNIYNIGFTGGIVGSFLIALLRGFGYDFAAPPLVETGDDAFMRLFIVTCLALAVASGLFASRRDWSALIRDAKRIYASTGRLVSDFTAIGSVPAALVNMGVMGLIASAYVILLGGTFNGPVVGAILTVTGFAAFGKHPRNAVPVLAGVYIASLFKIWETGTTPVIIAALFGTTLAPIAGSFGPVAGILAGFFHLSIVHNVGVLHGGVNLYNNGFAGGFVASFLVPVISAFGKKDTDA